MASRAAITAQILTEFGKSSPQVRQRIEQVVGDVTIDILSQFQSQFARLSEKETITLDVTTTAYKLPHDFASPKSSFRQVDSDGDFVGKLEIVTEGEFYDRKDNADYGGLKYAYIEHRANGADGPGDYLVLSGLPTTVGYFLFPYYRKPTENDTDIITNVSAIKNGVRAEFPEFTANAGVSLQKYEAQKPTMKESPRSRSTGMAIKPSKSQQRHNRNMYRIGRGG